MTGQLYGASKLAERRTMERDPIAVEAAELQDVLDALDDPDCRAILGQLDSPMAAKEISEACDIPQSTTYRKLDLLSEASLVDERTEIREDGRHTTRYVADFEEIQVSLDEDGSLDLSIDRTESTPEERLSALWSEVRTET